jgi:hypothetical protein
MSTEYQRTRFPSINHTQPTYLQLMKSNSVSTMDLTSVYQCPLYLDPLNLGGLEVRPLDLLEHVLATGGTGSGKTRAFLMPLIEQTLRRFGNVQEQKAGMFLVDAKGDMCQLAIECARRAGREGDVHILGEGGDCWFPLFDQFGGDATKIANFLFEILEDRTSKGALSRGGSNDSFWEENARRLLRAACSLAKAAHGHSFNGLSGISAAVNQILDYNNDTDDSFENDDPCAHSFRPCDQTALDGHAKGWLSTVELQDFQDYLQQDVKGGNPRTWTTIANMARNYLSQFSQPALRRIFQPDPSKKRIAPEDIIDGGVLLIVNLSPVIYGEAAAPFRMAVKKAFCERMLQRRHLCTMDDGKVRAINQVRPVLYVCDEFHTTLSAGQGGEASFLDRARESLCMCMLATQGISAILSVLGNSYLCDHLLNNCRTKVFFANDCPQTSEYFERIGGMEDRKVVSRCYTRRKALPRFRLPNHSYTRAATILLDTTTIGHQRLPRFCAAKLGALPNGSAFVVTKGRELKPYQRDPAEYAEPCGARSLIQI